MPIDTLVSNEQLSEIKCPVGCKYLELHKPYLRWNQSQIKEILGIDNSKIKEQIGRVLK